MRPPEDIIVGKLMAWQEGRSAKHPSDIYVVLSFMLSDLSEAEFDTDYVTRRAAQIGSDAFELWHQLLARVLEETAGDHPRF